MKRFNAISYNINRESIIDLPDIHHSLIIIPETLYENPELISSNSGDAYYNKSTTAISTYKIEEEEEEEEEEEVAGGGGGEGETTQSTDEKTVEVNDKVREINNDEKPKEYTEIDLSEPKQKNSFSTVRSSPTVEVVTPSHVEKSAKSKKKYKFLSCSISSNKLKLLIGVSIIIIIVVVIIIITATLA